ncbi:MAG: alpha/beta hydrolase family protein [Blastocatellia bacterium]|nr:alpha/beta hydrolase family protein [Blastocatellia bacterium]
MGMLLGLATLLTIAGGGATTTGQQQTDSSSIASRMRRLLQLPREKTAPKVEALQQSGDGEILLEEIRYQADRDHWVPAIVARPRAAVGPLPAIICLPGTNGTRQHLTDSTLRLTEFPRTGWSRALAAEGYVTIAIDYRGSPARDQNIYTDAVRAQLEGGSFMGQLVHEVVRAVDYLQTRPDVDRSRIGVTGFSLGGAMSWYAAAADPRLTVVVPVCGGVGTYDLLLGNQKRTGYHSQYFYPAGFLKEFPGDQPDVFAALAPRAVLVVGRDQDQGMPVEGLRKLEQEVKAAYARRGAADRFAVHVTPGEHTYTNEMFDQVKAWFARFLRR